MDSAIGERPEPLRALARHEVRRASEGENVMTGVWCRACDARYSAPVEPWIIDVIRRCGECGHPALEVVG